MAELVDRLTELRCSADDLAEQVRDLRDGFDFEPGELDELESRLDVIYRLKKKYGDSVEEMLDYIKASMARHKVPKYIDFVDAFPMNAAGKILKYKMREEATERFGLEGAAGIDTAQTAEQMKR